MLVHLEGRLGNADLQAIKDGVLDAGMCATSEGGDAVRPSRADWPQFGVIVNALEPAFSLTWQTSWPVFDQSGGTRDAIARVQSGLDYIDNTAPDWWAVIGRRGRLTGLVSELHFTDQRIWVSCGEHDRLVLYGSFEPPNFMSSDPLSLADIVRRLVRSQL